MSHLTMSQQFSTHIEIDSLFREVLESNKNIAYVWSISDDSGMSRKVIFRRRISSLQSTYRRFSSANPRLAEISLLKLVLTTDEYIGHKDFLDGVAPNKQVWHSGKHLFELEHFTRPRGGVHSIDFPMLQMERHLKFQQSQLFFSLSEQRKLTYFQEQFRKDLDSYTSTVVSNGFRQIDLQKLFEYQMAFKGSLMFAEIKMKQRIQQSSDQELISMFEEWKEAKSTLLNHGQNYDQWTLDSLTQRTNYIEDSLYYYSETGKSMDQREGEGASLGEEQNYSRDLNYVPIDELHKSLKPKEVVIEMIRYRNVLDSAEHVEYLALILKQGDSRITPIRFRDGILMENQGVKYYQNTIKYKTPNDKSYELFWKPIADALLPLDKQKIYFCGDGVYHSINIASLFNSEEKRYLMSELDVYLLPNSKMLLTHRKPKKRKLKNAMLMGYPAYDMEKLLDPKVGSQSEKINVKQLKRSFGESIPMLPGTKTEVERIGNILKKGRVKRSIYLFDQATESNLVKQQDINILHIATHGYFLENNDTDSENTHPLLQSGLLLAGSQHTLLSKSSAPISNHDGILTAYETMSMNLEQTDLVVLSACETGKGVLNNGDGVVGFQRAIFIAGAQNVIMSLWKVDDQATREFMIEFYKNYLSTNDKNAAFKIAQEKIKEKYQDPYYWGAFILVGI